MPGITSAAAIHTCSLSIQMGCRHVAQGTGVAVDVYPTRRATIRIGENGSRDDSACPEIVCQDLVPDAETLDGSLPLRGRDGRPSGETRYLPSLPAGIRVVRGSSSGVDRFVVLPRLVLRTPEVPAVSRISIGCVRFLVIDTSLEAVVLLRRFSGPKGGFPVEALVDDVSLVCAPFLSAMSLTRITTHTDIYRRGVRCGVGAILRRQGAPSLSVGGLSGGVGIRIGAIARFGLLIELDSISIGVLIVDPTFLTIVVFRVPLSC